MGRDKRSPYRGVPCPTYMRGAILLVSLAGGESLPGDADDAENLIAGAAGDQEDRGWLDAIDGVTDDSEGAGYVREPIATVGTLHILSPLSIDISGPILAETLAPGDPSAYLFHTGALVTTVWVASVKTMELAR